MKNGYRDFGYTTPAPGNAESGKGLADLFVKLTATLTDIRDICDLGCGNGYLAGRLAGLGYRVTGVDAANSGIKIAREHYGSERARFICANIDSETLRRTDMGKFDLIVSSDVIEHLYRPSDLIETAACLMRPGGHIIIGTPYHGYLKNIVLSVLNKWDKHHGVAWDGGHIKFFSVKTLGSLLAGHGFIDMRFYFYGRSPLLWKNVICHARRKAPVRCLNQ